MKANDPRIEKNLSELAKTLSLVDNNDLIKEFLHSLLTPAELVDVAGRWALVKALWQKKPQREIAADLGISLCKVTRGSRELKKANSAFARMLEKSEKI